MERKLIYEVEVKGTEQQVQKLNRLEEEMRQVTAEITKLKVKQRSGVQLDAEERAELTRLSQKKKELSIDIQRLNTEIKQTINVARAETNTLRGVNAALAEQRAKIQDVVIGSRQYQQIGAEIKRLEKLQRDYNQQIGRGRTFVGEYASGFQSAFMRMGAAVGGVMLMMRGFQNVFGKNLDVYKNAIKAEYSLEQAIKNRGETTRLTFDELKKEAQNLSKAGTASTSAILKGITNQLLTFTSISDANFKNTQKAVLDVATVLNQEGGLSMENLKNISIQLGKALNDPVRSLAALRRSGIQFTQEQTDMIKNLAETNRLGEAQALILQEVSRQYGGQYEAMAQGVGIFDQIRNMINSMRKEYGKAIFEGIQPFLDSFKSVIQFMAQNAVTIVKLVKAVGIMVAAYTAWRVVTSLSNKESKINLFFTQAMTAAKKAYALVTTGLTKGTKAQVAAQAAETIVTKGATAATTAQTMATEGATVATKALNTATKASPWGMIAAAVATLIGLLTMFSSRAKGATAAQMEVNDAMMEGQKSVESQKIELGNLLEVARDETQSLAAREAAIRKINEISPEYLGGITLAKINTKEAKDAVDSYVESMVKQAQVQQLTMKLAEVNNQINDKGKLITEENLTTQQKLIVKGLQATGQLEQANALREKYISENAATNLKQLQMDQATLESQIETLTRSETTYKNVLLRISAENEEARQSTSDGLKEQIEDETRSFDARIKQYHEALQEYAGDEEQVLTINALIEAETVKHNRIISELQSQASTATTSRMTETTEKVLNLTDELNKKRIENIQNSVLRELETENNRYEKQLELYNSMIVRKQTLSEKEIRQNEMVNRLIEQDQLTHSVNLNEIFSKTQFSQQFRELIVTEKTVYDQTVENLRKEYGETQKFNELKETAYQTYVNNTLKIINTAEIQKATRRIYEAEIKDIDKTLAEEITKEEQRWETEQVLYDNNYALKEQKYGEHLTRMDQLRAMAESGKAIAQPFELQPEEELPESPEVMAAMRDAAMLERYRAEGLESLAGNLAAKRAMLDTWHKLGLVSEEQYQRDLTTIEKTRAEARQQLVGATLQGMIQVFGEQSKIGRAAVIAEKAFALAEAAIALGKGLAKTAGTVPFPANIPLIAGVIGQFAAFIASIKAVKTPEIESPKVRVSKFGTGGTRKAKATDRGQVIEGVGSWDADNILAMVSPEEAVINARTMKSQDVMTLTGTPRQIASDLNSYKNYGVPFAFGKAPVPSFAPPVFTSSISQQVNNDLIKQIVNETVEGIRKIPVVVTEYDISNKQRLVRLTERAGDL